MGGSGSSGGLLHLRALEADQHAWSLDQSFTRSAAVVFATCGNGPHDGSAELGASGKSEALVAWLFERPRIAKCGFAAGLVIELIAPLGVLGETALTLVGIALLALHKANGRLLGLRVRSTSSSSSPIW